MPWSEILSIPTRDNAMEEDVAEQVIHESTPPEHEANPELEPAPEPRVEHEPLEKA